MKTYGNYAYVTSDQGNAGLLVIDLSNLPNSISSSYYRPVLTVGTVTDTLKRQHTITMDEDGYMYLNGTNIDKGQPLAFDVHTTPGSPSTSVPSETSTHTIATPETTPSTNPIYTTDASAFTT
jgi:hypothetical protein